ncbi:hypothetical protein GGS20DRAFT_530818 [Poronia punctata]|nr:hypothetical protein GGS20DRAFT_530818 [Poronia punctata]
MYPSFLALALIFAHFIYLHVLSRLAGVGSTGSIFHMVCSHRPGPGHVRHRSLLISSHSRRGCRAHVSCAAARARGTKEFGRVEGPLGEIASVFASPSRAVRVPINEAYGVCYVDPAPGAMKYTYIRWNTAQNTGTVVGRHPPSTVVTIGRCVDGSRPTKC